MNNNNISNSNSGASSNLRRQTQSEQFLRTIDTGLPATNNGLVRDFDREPSIFVRPRLGSDPGSTSAENPAGTGNSRIASRFKSRYNNVPDRRAEAFDTNKDGVVSDQESLAYLVKLKKYNSNRGLDQLRQFNSHTDIINQELNNIDKDSNGRISDKELIQGLLKTSTNSTNSGIRELILNLNNKKTIIEEKLSLVDTDGNRNISDREVLSGLMKLKAGELSQEDAPLVRSMIETNSNFSSLEEALNQVDSDSNGRISRQEVWSVLRAARREEISQSELNKLYPILELNPHLDDIVTDFNNSIEGKYNDEQIVGAQVLVTRIYQEAILKGVSSADTVEEPSLQYHLEALAEIYADDYLSEDETSSDYYKMNGISGMIQDELISQGYTLDQIINGEANADDIKKMSDIMLSLVDRDLTNQAPDVFDAQHLEVKEYLINLGADSPNDVYRIGGTTLPQVLNYISEIYGDLGFAGDPDGFAGFTGAIQESLDKAGFNTLGDSHLKIAAFVPKSALDLMIKRINEVLEIKPSVEENLESLDRRGVLDVLSKVTGKTTENKMINAILLARYADGITGDEIFKGLNLNLDSAQKEAVKEHLEKAFINEEFDLNLNGETAEYNEIDMITKYLNGVRGEALIQERPSQDYSPRQNLEALALIEEVWEEARFGGTETHSIDFDQTIPGFLGMLADIYGDAGIPGSTNPDEQFEGISGELFNRLRDNGFEVNDLERPLTYFDIDFIKDQMQDITGLSLDLGFNKPLHEKTQSLIEEKIALFNAGDAATTGQSVPDLLEEISHIYSDIGEPGINNPETYGWTGFTGAIQKGISDFDTFDTSSPLTIETLFSLRDTFDRMFNPEAVSDELLPEMNNYNHSFRKVINRLEEVMLGGTARNLGSHNDQDLSLSGFLTEIAEVWGDIHTSIIRGGLYNDSVHHYTGFTGELEQKLIDAGHEISDAPLNQEQLQVILGEIRSQTDDYDFSRFTNFNSVDYSLTKDFKQVQDLLNNWFDGSQLETSIGSLLGVIADVFGDPGIPGSSDPYEAFQGLTSSIQKGLIKDGFNTFDLNEAVTPEALANINARIENIMQMYLDQDLVEEIVPLEFNPVLPHPSNPDIPLTQEASIRWMDEVLETLNAGGDATEHHVPTVDQSVMMKQVYNDLRYLANPPHNNIRLQHSTRQTDSDILPGLDRPDYKLDADMIRAALANATSLFEQLGNDPQYQNFFQLIGEHLTRAKDLMSNEFVDVAILKEDGEYNKNSNTTLPTVSDELTKYIEAMTPVLDLNGSGEIDLADGNIVKTALVNKNRYPDTLSDLYRENLFDFNNDDKTDSRDLRILTKYTQGLRDNDLLRPETGETMGFYIENYLGQYSYTEENIKNLTNIVLGLPTSSLSFSSDYSPSAEARALRENMESGLYDINNDGVTDLKDLELLYNYSQGKRGDELSQVSNNPFKTLLDAGIIDAKTVFDTDGNKNITPLDALKVINHVNAYGEIRPGDVNWDPRLDVNKDGIINSADTRVIVNYLNNQ